jgi:hypothetical protein
VCDEHGVDSRPSPTVLDLVRALDREVIGCSGEQLKLVEHVRTLRSADTALELSRS